MIWPRHRPSDDRHPSRPPGHDPHGGFPCCACCQRHLPPMGNLAIFLDEVGYLRGSTELVAEALACQGGHAPR